MADLALDLAELMDDWDGLRRLARSLVRGDAAADDVVQDAFAAVARGAMPTRGGDLRAWMRGVVRRIAGKHNRTEVRRLQRETKVAATSGEPTAPSPAESLERLETRRAVIESLQRLGDPQRHALYLRYFEDLSPTDIAARLGVPLATVKSWLHRGLESLRTRLDERHGGNRKTWIAALLPWARGAEAAPILVPMLLGAGAWAALATFALALALAAALGLGWISGPAWSEGSPAAELAEAAAHSPGSPTLAGSGPSAHREGTLSGRGPEGPDLGRRLAYAGRVVDEGHSPIDGAEVSLRLTNGAECVTRSGANGRFLLAATCRPSVKLPFLLVAWRGSQCGVAVVWESPLRPWQVRADEPRDVGDLVLREAFEVPVTVRGRGGPHDSVRLSLIPDLNYAPPLAVTYADSEGGARFAGVPSGRYLLVADVDGRRHASREIVVARPPHEPVEIDLAAGRSVEVAVCDEVTRAPVAGATVRLREQLAGVAERLGATLWADSAAARSDTLGRARLEGIDPRRALDLTVTAPGYVEFRETYRFPGDVGLTLPLCRAATVRWRLASDGLRAPPSEGTVLSLAFSYAQEMPLEARVEDGFVVVTGLARRPFKALASAADETCAELAWDGQGTDGLSTEFRPIHTIDFRLEQSDGSPAADWYLAAGPYGTAGSPRVFRTDREGRAALGPFPRGTVSVVAHGTALVRVDEEVARVDVEAGDPEVIVRMERLLEGRVRLRVGGRPWVPSANEPSAVQLWSRGRRVPTEWDPSDEGTIKFRIAPSPTTTKDAAGEPHVVAENAPEVVLVARGHLPQTRRLPTPDSDGISRWTVDLAPAGALVVYLQEPSDSTRAPDPLRWDSVASLWSGQYAPDIERWDAVRGAWSYVAPDAARRGDLLGPLDSNPRPWRIGPLAGGRYRVIDVVTGETSAPVDVIAGSPPSSVDMDFSRAGEVRGRVLLPPGFEPSGAWIEAECTVRQAAGSTTRARRVAVQPDGTFAIRVAGVRPLTLTAGHPLLVADPAEGHAEVAGPTTGVSMRLVSVALARVRLVFPAGTTSSAAGRLDLGRVVLYDGEPAGPPRSDHRLRSQAAASGARSAGEADARFTGYLAGTYTVLVDLPGFAPAVLRDVVLDDAVTDLGPILLERGSSVRVNFPGLTGRGRTWLRVSALRLAEPSTTETRFLDSSTSDELLIPGLPAGRYRLRAETRGSADEPWLPAASDRVVDVDGHSDATLDFELR